MEPTKELKQAVKSYREGKAEAFTTLYEESGKYIYTCIRKVIGNSDNAQDVISDIMQDTYVEISKSISQLDREESFLSWAGTIATRKCYAWVKKNRKYVLLSEEDDTFENLVDDCMIPEEIMQDREKQRLIREIVEEQLTEMQKICIIAYYYNGQKQSEIAEDLGISENTVKTNLSRAKAKIKNGVLELEKKQDTKLYSVAPLLMLLFREDLSVCVVPNSITTSVKAAVAAVGGIGRKVLFAKLAAVSVKAKVAAGIIGVGVIVFVSGNVYFDIQNKKDAALMEAQNHPVETSRESDFEADTPEEPEQDEGQTNITGQEDKTDEENEADIESEEEQAEVTLSEEEQHDIETLVSLLTLDGYFFGGGMDSYQYPVDNMGMFVNMMNIVGSFSTMNDSYAKYLPEMEMDMDEYMGYSDVEEIQSYVNNVFGVEAADMSAYSENGKVSFLLYLDRMKSEVSIDSVARKSDGTYEISGNVSIIEFGPTVNTFPYLLIVTRNEDSVFGYQVVSMSYGMR